MEEKTAEIRNKLQLPWAVIERVRNKKDVSAKYAELALDEMRDAVKLVEGLISSAS